MFHQWFDKNRKLNFVQTFFISISSQIERIRVSIMKIFLDFQRSKEVNYWFFLKGMILKTIAIIKIVNFLSLNLIV